jgi:uncharacterized protein YdgA (DUF945 family)
LKKALIIAVALVAIVIVLPFADGCWVKKKYYAVTHLASRGAFVSLQVIDYHRGWFSSTATVKVSLGASTITTSLGSTLPVKPNFIIKEKIYHGPIILRSDKPFEKFGQGFTWALALSEVNVNQPDLQVNGLAVFHYDNSLSVNFDCPHILVASAEPGKTYGIQGLTGIAHLAHHFKHAEGEMTLASADIPLQNGAVTLKNAHYNYALDQHTGDTWYGNRSLQIGDLMLNSSDKFELKGVKFSLTDNITTDKLNSRLATQVAGIKINDTEFGQQQFVFNVSNLNLKTLLELGNKAQVLDQLGSPMAVRALELTPLALQLLSDGVNLNLTDVNLNTKWGAIRGSASVDLPKQTQANTQLQTLLINTTGIADFTFPAKLAQDMLELRYQSVITPQQQSQLATSAQTMAKENIDRWVLAGWLNAVGDQYQVNISYKKAELLLNGKPIKLPSMPIPDSQPKLPQR